MQSLNTRLHKNVQVTPSILVIDPGVKRVVLTQLPILKMSIAIHQIVINNPF